MKVKLAPIALVAALLVGLIAPVACTPTQKGATIGAATGAAGGALIGGHRKRTRSAAIGAVAGGILGGVIGHTYEYTKFCPSCGRRFHYTKQYCPYCSTPLMNRR